MLYMPKLLAMGEEALRAQLVLLVRRVSQGPQAKLAQPALQVQVVVQQAQRVQRVAKVLQVRKVSQAPRANPELRDPPAQLALVVELLVLPVRRDPPVLTVPRVRMV